MARICIRDKGNINGSVLVIGEAPGKREIEECVPFVGPSGWKLKEWMKTANIDLPSIYYTNVLQFMPKGGNLEAAIKSGNVTQKDIEEGATRVRSIAEHMPNLRVIVPIGNYAMYAFSDLNGTVAWDKNRAGITKCRGSIYTHKVNSGRMYGPNGSWGNKVKVIGTIHPAAVLRQDTTTAGTSWQKRCILDWIRIAHEIDELQIEAPERNHTIVDSITQLEQFYEELKDDDVLGFDIETWGGDINIIGFAKDAQNSLVVPLIKSHWHGNQAILDTVWILVAKILQHSCDKLAHFGLFDCWWLRQKGIEVRGFHWDTMSMHHALDAMEPHALEYLASTLTREPYWKDESKDAESIVRLAKNSTMERLYIYNGLDVTVMWEIFDKLYTELEKKSMLKFYLKHYADMHEPILDMMTRGALFDEALAAKLREEHTEQAVEARDRASRLAGKPLWTFDKTRCEREMLELYWANEAEPLTKDEIFAELQQQKHKDKTITAKWQELYDKGISDDHLNLALYEDLGCPKPATKTGTGKVKADNIVLKTLQNTVASRKRPPATFKGNLEGWQSTVQELIDQVLLTRRSKKLASFLKAEGRVDGDGRLRCHYKFTTKTGRLSSSSNPGGTGTNLQNIDRTLHHVFVAAPGFVLLECDLSQAESRNVKCLTGDKNLIALAQRHPLEADEHRENAALLFGIDQEQVTSDQRFIGKRGVHAANYGMKGKRLSEILLKDGYTYTPRYCQGLIDIYLDKFQGIKSWQSKVRRIMISKHKLFTSWGRFVDFKYIDLNDDIYRFGYSFVPQSEIGDLLNHNGLIPLHYFLRNNKMKSRIVLQVHDSLVVEAWPSEVHTIMCFLESNLTKERRYGGVFGLDVPLSVPVEFALGKRWEKKKEWKYLADKEEVDAIVEELLSDEQVA